VAVDNLWQSIPGSLPFFCVVFAVVIAHPSNTGPLFAVTSHIRTSYFPLQEVFGTSKSGGKSKNNPLSPPPAALI
jgi:hypothetical protein